MSNVDKTIARDLAALAENSRRDVPPLDEALRTTDAYRDDRPGAEARRNALADQRRKELVLMPLTLAHVFAHRLGRIAAGGMALAASLVMLAMMADPLLMRFAAWFIPGLNVGMLVLIAAVAVLGSYVIASWIGEAWFARRMRQAIQTSANAYDDIEQLAEGPLEIAQRAVARLDSWSIGVFLAGAASITCVFGYTLVIVGLNHTISNAWSMIGIADYGGLQRNVGALAIVVGLSIAVSFLLARDCSRDRVATSIVARALGSWTALAIAGVIGVVVLYKTFHIVVDFRPRQLLDHRARYFLTLATALVVFLPFAWSLLFWRRREQARIR